MTAISEYILTPSPKTITAQPGQLFLPNQGLIACPQNPDTLLPIALRLQQNLQPSSWSISAINDPAATIVLLLDPQANILPQGYHLNITTQQIQITASDPAGIFYAVATLNQILQQSNATIPACRIQDAPDFPVRGVMLDVSRDKVPTLDTLYQLIDQLAQWKINHVELYTEHTFAYRNHRRVWAQASPLTSTDILKLDAYCRDRFVELTANQNSFGHCERWLQYPEYRSLANCPDGCTLNGEHRDAFSLDPTNPKALQLLDELYSELLPHFTSDKFNVGCDETFDLGQGNTETICKEKGKYNVYFDFLLQIQKLVKKHNRKMLFWGDIILEHPELIPELPKDIIALNWGYEAEHPYEKQSPLFEQAGVEFYVAPGTSSWGSIIGRTDNCIANLKKAAVQGLKHNATGYLNTDWGDNGHWHYLPISYLGFLAGAAFSWNSAAHQDDNFIDALNRHAFRDQANVMGRLAHDLGNAYLHSGAFFHNYTAIYHFLAFLEKEPPKGVTTKTLQTTIDYIDQTIAPLANARMDRPDAFLITDEFRNNTALARHACQVGIAQIDQKLNDTATRQNLQAQLDQIIGRHQTLWTARNRTGGLQDSIKKLQIHLQTT
ncbi:MAG: family 20 glycosylhydrolase [Sedimentisphaerales bacterium]|nr:family 20 glycosylhydrolase [Sedimentisphaerales bacterium]